MTQEEQSKLLVESLEKLSQALRNMGVLAEQLCDSLNALRKTKAFKDSIYIS